MAAWRTAREFASAMGIVAALLGALVLFDWFVDLDVLRRLNEDFASMKANTALCLILLGTAITLMAQYKAPKGRRVLAGLAFLIGAVTLLQYLTGIDARIDHFIVRDAGGPLTSHPGRMSPSTALALTVLSAPILAGVRATPKWTTATSLGAAALTLLGLVGYIFDVEPLYGASALTTGMAPHTAVSLLLLSVGILLCLDGQGPLGFLWERGPGREVVIRAGTASIVVPLALGLIIQRLQVARILDAGMADAILSITMIVAMFLVAVLTARVVHGLDVARQAALVQIAEARQDLEIRVAERTQELERLNTELERFVGAVTHDVREPLLVLRLAAARLGRKLGDADAETQRQLDDMDAAIRNADQLIRTMLDWSRQLGRPPQVEPIDLEQCLEDALRDLQARIDESDAEIRTNPLPHCQGSMAHVKLVLQNLIGNAIKHGGTPPLVEVRVDPESDDCKVMVLDNGPGVPAGEREAIFEPFHKVAGTEKEGVGLGLALVRRLVEAQGGTVGVENRPQGGAAFWFTLASAEREPDDADGESEPDDAEPGPPTEAPSSDLAARKDEAAAPR